VVVVACAHSSPRVQLIARLSRSSGVCGRGKHVASAELASHLNATATTSLQLGPRAFDCLDRYHPKTEPTCIGNNRKTRIIARVGGRRDRSRASSRAWVARARAVAPGSALEWML
jgi:hypothetical protein